MLVENTLAAHTRPSGDRTQTIVCGEHGGFYTVYRQGNKVYYSTL